MDKLNIGGQEYRVEANWNALISFLESKGETSLESLQNFGKLKLTDIAGLMAACINEGERLEGHECNFDEKSIGAIISMPVVAAFLQIYQRQSCPQLPQDDPGK